MHTVLNVPSMNIESLTPWNTLWIQQYCTDSRKRLQCSSLLSLLKLEGQARRHFFSTVDYHVQFWCIPVSRDLFTLHNHRVIVFLVHCLSKSQRYVKDCAVYNCSPSSISASLFVAGKRPAVLQLYSYSRIDWLGRWTTQLTLSILLYAVISKLEFFFALHDSLSWLLQTTYD